MLGTALSAWDRSDLADLRLRGALALYDARGRLLDSHLHGMALEPRPRSPLRPGGPEMLLSRLELDSREGPVSALQGEILIRASEGPLGLISLALNAREDLPPPPPEGGLRARLMAALGTLFLLLLLLALYLLADGLASRWGALRRLLPPVLDPRGMGFRYRLLPQLLTLHGTLSTRYRVPTLNDRYWVPGGNPDLHPEHGWGAAGGLDLTLPRRQNTSWHLSWQGDAYYNLNKDQIRWLPHGAFWQPENVGEVRSYGLENSAKVFWHHHRLTLRTLVSHYLTRSVVTDDAGETHDSRYTPRHAATATLRADYGIFFSGLYLRYTGKRSTTTDNNPLFDLDPYLITSLVAGVKAGKGAVQYHLQLTADNLFNVQYQVIRSYAMPGRAFSGKLIITFKTK